MTSPHLHVVTSDQRRGAEVRAAELVAELRRRGGDERLVALRGSRSTATVPADPLGFRPPRHPSTLLSLRRRLRGVAAVIGHGGDTLAAVGLSAAGTGVPFVYESVGDPRFWRSSPAARLRTRPFLRRAAAVVTLFPGAADALAEEGVDRRRIRVIPSGIDPSRFDFDAERARRDLRARLRIPLDAPVVAFVGALSEEKDPLAAVAALPDGAHLLVAGGGPLLAALRAASVHRSGRVHVLGALEDVRPVYVAADVVVLPSRTEGLPGVAIEAAFCGVPVVATDVGGLSSVVEDGVTGLLVPAGDAASLAAAMATALRPGSLDGSAARALALERFDLARTAGDWRVLLDEVGR